MAALMVNDVTNVLSTREIAAAFWLSVFIIWALAKPEMRASIRGVIRAALHPKLFVPVLLMTAYTTVVVWALYTAGLWTTDLLKDTLLWFLFSGLALAFSFAQVETTESILRRILSDQVKIVLLVEYLLNTYTFPLPIEMVLQPILAGLAMIGAVAQSDPKHVAVTKLTTALQAMLGLSILAFALGQAISKYSTFQVVDSLRSVALAPTLSLLFAPCIYVLVLFTTYELLFVRLKIGSPKDRQVTRYAQRTLIRHLGLKPQRVRAFMRARGWQLAQIGTRADVDRLLMLEEGSKRPKTVSGRGDR